MRYLRSVLLAGVSSVSVFASALVSGQTPPAAQPAAKQPATLAEARKALGGKWLLVTLTVHNADGRNAIIEASGTLTMDFNNLTIEFRMTETGLKTLAGLGITSPNPVISSSGHVQIDTQQRKIAYVGEDFQEKALGFDPALAAKRANPFALERIRYYVFNTDGTLRLATHFDNGKDASVSVWKKGT
jgi:hypothetical protein